jgi:predicted site-specific integrase-resolvase
MQLFLKPKEACEFFNISYRTLLNWSYDGRITFIRNPAGHRRYVVEDGEQPKVQRRICYCRVSTNSQKEDLERQINFFRIEYPGYEIVTDIGSGINFKRKGFNSILDLAISGDLKEVVVTHRDRLCRFGFELIKRIVQERSNGVIVVLDKTETSPEQELTRDLVSIITVFSSRLYGLRSNKIKKAIKELQNNEVSSVSHGGGGGESEEVFEAI